MVVELIPVQVVLVVLEEAVLVKVQVEEQATQELQILVVEAEELVGALVVPVLLVVMAVQVLLL